MERKNGILRQGGHARCVNFDRMLMGYVGASGSGFKKGRDERWTPLLFPSETRRSV